MTITVTPSQLEIAVSTLSSGGLVAFPTETVYGLGADARNSSAVRRIFEVKGRPSNNPLIVHVATVDAVTRYADLSRSYNPQRVQDRLAKLSTLWPGPLSVVLPAAPTIAREVSAGGDTVALRIPNHPIALALLKAFNGPVAAPSANPSNYISPTTAQHVKQGLGDAVDCILDGGPCAIGLESTVLSLLEPTPRILRPGAVTKEHLEQTLGCNVISAAPPGTPTLGTPLQSPGLMEKHYSPTTPVVLLTSVDSSTKLPARVGAILFAPRALPFTPLYTTVLSDSGDLASVAVKLFAALRDLDSKKLDLIVVDTCEPLGLGEAIMDRLVRAAR